MLVSISLFSLMLFGFLSGGHCMSMCGGLSSAFALQLPPDVSRLKLLILLNLGRITSYVLIGAILGGLGQFGISLDQSHGLQNGLFVLANILLIFMGLYLAGLSSWIVKVEKLGQPIWRRLSPILNRLLPIKSAWGCLGVGALWGWLPCGLVYSASLYALSSGSIVQGALCLLAFGIGTLPNLLAIGVFASQLKSLLQKSWVRWLTGLTVCLWAIWQLSSLILLGWVS